jgi:hypothetical protein
MRWLLIILLSCVAAAPAPRPASRPSFKLGTIKPEALRECSGLVASRRHAGVFWALNDSGNPPALFAITRDGELIREYPVSAKNVDWEDLAVDDDGHLYIADVGNNRRDRKEVLVMRVDEPDPRAPLTARVPAPVRVTQSWRLTFPGDTPFDCESLFVLGGRGYVLPKRLDFSPAELYRFDLPSEPPSRPQRLEHVATIPSVRAPVTAADVSPDGKRLAVLTVLGPYVFRIDDAGGNFSSLATARPSYSRYLDPRMESACFTNEGLLVTTETRDVLLFRDEHFTPPLDRP